MTRVNQYMIYDAPSTHLMRGGYRRSGHVVRVCKSIRQLGMQELLQSSFSVLYEREFTVASPFDRLYPTPVEEIMRE